jgi:trans-2,3-dihydro-3-hydroxyanthranilate isomerase
VSAGRPLAWLDVFTAEPLAGNALAVVHDADGLDEATMLAFARETRLSETTFVQSPTVDGADYRNRIFWPNGEMRFAGHPTLGTAVAVAVARGERDARYVQQTPSGLQPVEARIDGDAAFASMLQNAATFGAEVAPADVLIAAGLQRRDADPQLPMQIVSTGQPHLIAPVRDTGVLERARPEPRALGPLLERLGASVLYLAACDPAAGTARARGFFLDQYGALTEDPATGSAAGPLLAHLHARAGTQRLEVRQGVEMGRPSRLSCEMHRDRVRDGGDVVVLATGTVAL